MKQFLKESLENHRYIFADGGLGTYLQAHGLTAGILPETFNYDHPEVLHDIHRAYYEAGSHFVYSNTFGANRFKFPEGSEYPVSGIVSAGVKILCEERDAYRAAHPDRQVFAALDIGPTGRLLKPMGDLDFEEAVSVFSEVIKAGALAGADCVVIETMSDSYELKAAVLAAKESCDLPIFATMIFSENGKLLTGAEPAGAVAMLEGLGVDALGVNCGLGPEQMRPIVHQICEAASIPVMVVPNAGLPHVVDGDTVFDVLPEDFAASVQTIVSENEGIAILGGCCGTTPAHIQALTKLLKDEPAKPPVEKKDTVISSGMGYVNLSAHPVIIGERINPTGKSKFKQALRDHNIEYILNEGISEEEHGAHILDVNVGLPDIDEVEMLKSAVFELQGVTPLPLQIDTSDITAMEAAMRLYNGKPMVNSVNGKQESMEAVFPLIKKYGGVVVALLLDESGIPDSVEGRLKVADKIYETAARYGIAKKDIVLDALVLTISTDSNAAKVTLDTVRRIHEDYKACTVLGVSNVSFGLPRRDLINSAFYTMALNNGLTAGIINPNATAMKTVYDTFMAIHGYDSQCNSFIETYANTTAPTIAPVSTAADKNASADTNTSPISADGDSPLKNAIIKGLKEKSTKEAALMLDNGSDPLSLINDHLMPALDFVGQGFEKGTTFLPQLLMSAEAAKACFAVIKERLLASGNTGKSNGTIILATVKGDIHDIGKNIVKVLLENYSYNVIDLGKDVPPELIVQTAIEKDVHLIGLSALMTTTVVSMADTIKMLREAGVDCKVVVGGAVLTQEYADMIGADAYCKDAMSTVRYADSFFGVTN